MSAAISTLSQIVEISTSLTEALRKNDSARLAELDQRLKRAIDQKERALRAWREHSKEHGC